MDPIPTTGVLADPVVLAIGVLEIAVRATTVDSAGLAIMGPAITALKVTADRRGQQLSKST